MSTSEIDKFTHTDKSTAIAKCIAKLKKWDWDEDEDFENVSCIEFASDHYYKGLCKDPELDNALSDMGEMLGFDHPSSLAYVSYSTGMRLSYFHSQTEEQLWAEYLSGKVVKRGNLVSFLHSTMAKLDIPPKNRLDYLVDKYNKFGIEIDSSRVTNVLSGNAGAFVSDEIGNVNLLLERLAEIFGLSIEFVRSEFNFNMKSFDIITGDEGEVKRQLDEEFSYDIDNSMKVCGGLVKNENGTYSVLVQYREQTPNITLSTYV